MKVYQVITKIFYQKDGVDYQVADALEPIETYSSKKKAIESMNNIIEFWKKRGYQGEKYNQLFPVEHRNLKGKDSRVLVYYLETEVD